MLLLNTKLNVPLVRPSHEQRIEIIQKLNSLQDYKLALIATSGRCRCVAIPESVHARRCCTRQTSRAEWVSTDSPSTTRTKFRS